MGTLASLTVVQVAKDLTEADRLDLIEQWMPLAESLAKRFKGRTDSLPDLKQEALLGLAQAAHDYQPDREVHFGRHATVVIRQHLCRYRAKARPIPISYNANKHAIKLSRARKALVSSGEVEPSVERLAGAAGITVDQAASVLASQWHRLPAEPDGFAWADDDSRETIADVLGGLDELPEEFQEVLIRRFGLDGEPPETSATIGLALGISDSAARWRTRRAISRLREIVDET